ncbi:MAG TPA: hypothetical protein VMT30_03675 [Candidatus Saccharimonadia bacterium]|nr:hypothetical protein [Candidatus Saccharimonadia bacterium]
MNLKLDLDFKKWLPIVRRLQPYIFGLALVGVFAYTAYVLNAALNVGPDPTPVATANPATKVVFDKATIDAVKSLDVVEGGVPVGDLGKSDPFK